MKKVNEKQIDRSEIVIVTNKSMAFNLMSYINGLIYVRHLNYFNFYNTIHEYFIFINRHLERFLTPKQFNTMTNSSNSKI